MQTKFQLKYSSIYLPILRTRGYHYLLIFEWSINLSAEKEKSNGGRKN